MTTTTGQNRFKRSLALLLALLMILSINTMGVFAQDTVSATKTMKEKYIVPIASLVSSAPLPPVQTAFAKAFGDTVTVIVDAQGNKTARIKNQHMIVDMAMMGMGKFDANVASIIDADASAEGIQNATILSTKQEIFSNPNGNLAAAPVQTDITVPDELEIPLNLNSAGAQRIVITVDFMDYLLGGGNPYSTTVTLTLDMENAVLDMTELKSLADETRSVDLENYTETSVKALRVVLANADAMLASGAIYADANDCYMALSEAYAALEYKSADYSAVDAAIAKIPADLSGYTYKSVNNLKGAVNSVDRTLTIADQSKVDAMAKAVEDAVASLETLLTSSEGKYIVPIASLVSSAPLPPVQTAFAKAFGDTVTVIVDAQGNKTARIKNQHMIVDMAMMGMGKFDANVASIIDADASAEGIQNATILSTKQEIFSNPNGNLAAAPVQTDITVPDELEIPLNLNSAGAQRITITVDFMDYLLGGGNPYSTTVTLTLDMDAAIIDVSDLEALIGECEAISAETNYTTDSFSALTDAIEKAKAAAADPQTVEKLNAMIAELNDVRACLEYKGADYSAVEAAIAKIPADSAIYTDETWTAVETARKAVVNGLNITRQEEVDAYAANLEAAIGALEIKDADYALVDQALASVPADTSKYTDETIAKVNAAIAAVERGLKADKQTEVNAMAAAITGAVAALQEKATATPTPDDKLDISNLKDGVYEIPAALWHASEDRASMAASSFGGTARVVVQNGRITVYVYTQPMTFGAITASLQEMKVAQSDGTWIAAAVEAKSGDGNPTCFSFSLDKLSRYVTAKVNPHVEMMGNQDLDARIKFDLDSVRFLSEKTDEKPTTPPAGIENNASVDSPKTGDDSNIALWMSLMLASAAAFAGLTFVKKRRLGSKR